MTSANDGGTLEDRSTGRPNDASALEYTDMIKRTWSIGLAWKPGGSSSRPNDTLLRSQPSQRPLIGNARIDRRAVVTIGDERLAAEKRVRRSSAGAREATLRP
jgi:hypothetical protein